MQTLKLSMPFDLIKSRNEGEMRIGGYASTADPDRQGECIMQRSLDISDFVQTGFFNLDHDSSKILGYPDPEECRIDDRGLYVEGTLLKGVPEAESIYRSAAALQKANTSRRLGFSVEGKALERNSDGLITKAKIYHVAITATPVNPNCTWDALCKSFGIGVPDTYAADDVDKALTTGDYAQAQGVDAQVDGAALQTESLESAFCTLAHIIGSDDIEANGHLSALREVLRRRGKLHKSELTLYFALEHGLTLPESQALVEETLQRRKIA